jgi:signal transduction histidine kinase/DNA-binding response OmpR family regulator
MPLRTSSLKARTALAIASVIAVVLVANAVYLILTKRNEMRQEIEERALNFAVLTRPGLGAAFDTTLGGDPRPLLDAVREAFRRNADLTRVSIVDRGGRTLFDSAGLTPRADEPELLAAIARGDTTTYRGREPSGEEVMVIATPYVPVRGEAVFVVERFSYRSLRPSIVRLVYATTGLTLLSILISMLVATALATRITRPIGELTAGAQEISEGNFERRLAIRSNDELQILADAFNHMAERLKQNVAELEASNQKLAALNAELQQLDRMKSDLLANVSHELRTPLTAIKGYTDYIIEGKLGQVTEKQEKGLTVVQRNLERLTKTINALLDFSRMEAGRISLHLQPFALGALVEQVHGMLRSEVEKKRLVFAVEVEPGLPPVIADREKISAVLENLLVNAIKFTPEGGRVAVSAARARGPVRAEAEIRVSDTGPGIAPEQLEKIFTRFHQADSSSTRRFGGVGLGLAIVRSILEAHGSSISAERSEGGGAAFRFTLPVLEKAESRAAESGAPAAREGLVLVMENDPLLVRALGRELEEEAFSVMSASNPRDAAALASDRGPDAVVIDLTLPDRSGLELLQQLRRDPATRRIPLLAIGFQGQAVKAVRLGATDSLPAAASRESLLASLRRLLDGAGGGRRTVLVVDHDPDAAAAARDALAGEGFRVQVAYDARQAIEIIDRGRPDAVVLDVLMPEQSSLEVLAALGREEEAVGLPPLLLTGRAGAAGPVLEVDPTRPFDAGPLVAQLRRLVRGPAHRDPVRQSQTI